MKTVITAEEIKERVAGLGREITEYYKGRELTVCALMNGAMIFCADLVREIKLPLIVDSAAVSSYEKLQSSGKLNFRAGPKNSVMGRHVLVVDDIFDTGFTLAEVMKYFKNSGALSVECCCLLNKKDVVKKAPAPKWVGFDIPQFYVAGYGLDADEIYRNLPDICDFEG